MDARAWDERYAATELVWSAGPNQFVESELGTGRYTHFIDRIYRLGEDLWGIFSLQKLARTPEFRQAAA